MKKNKKKHKAVNHHKNPEKVSEIKPAELIAETEGLSNEDVIILESAIKNDSESNQKEEKIEKHRKNNLIEHEPKNKRNKIFVSIFLLLVIGSYAFSFQEKVAAKNVVALKDKTEKYIKENLVQPGTDLKITDFAKEDSLYKFTVKVGSQEIVSYVTSDGKRLLINPIDLDGENKGSDSKVPAPAAEATAKKDVPEVELFVMSLCPYGIQAEKGILPVVEKLGSKINFAVKFVDYTLHGKKEFDENLNQYCIQKEEPEKFNDYLACFAKDGDSVKCATQTKISKEKNSSCVSATDKEFKLTENFSANGQTSPFNIHKDLNDKYGVQGSPGLVVNGQLLESGRDSASLLKTICSGFSNQPEECSESLPSVSPTPGFGG